MNKRFIMLVAGLVLTSGVFDPISISTAHAGSFSNASLSGRYAAIYHGSEWFTPPGGSAEKIDISATGFTYYDGSGKQHGMVTAVLQGDSVDFGAQIVCMGTFSGTYSVNADGTGTKSFSEVITSGPCGNATGTLSFAIGNGGADIKLQVTSESTVSPSTDGVINSIILTANETLQ